MTTPATQDLREVKEALQSLLDGNYLLYGFNMSGTKTGVEVLTLIHQLSKKLYTEMMKNSMHDAEITLLQKELDGLRDTNEQLTTMLENK